MLPQMAMKVVQKEEEVLGLENLVNGQLVGEALLGRVVGQSQLYAPKIWTFLTK